MNAKLRSELVKKIAGFFVAAFLISGAYAQEVGHVDLRRHEERKESEPGIPELLRPTECGNQPAGYLVDGGIQANAPHNIVVAVMKLSNKHPELGADIEAEVMLKNLGQAPVAIPWFTNPSQLDASQNDSYKQWEVGQFVIKLRGKGRETLLRSLSGALYSSPYANGSTLSLKKGEWLTATLKFKLQPKWPKVSPPVPPGKYEVFAEWRQEMQTSKRIGCEINSGFFPYKRYYRQEHGATTLVISANK